MGLIAESLNNIVIVDSSEIKDRIQEIESLMAEIGSDDDDQGGQSQTQGASPSASAALDAAPSTTGGQAHSASASEMLRQIRDIWTFMEESKRKAHDIWNFMQESERKAKERHLEIMARFDRQEELLTLIWSALKPTTTDTQP